MIDRPGQISHPVYRHLVREKKKKIVLERPFLYIKQGRSPVNNV